MARNFVFPDPGDRSPNKPNIIVSPEVVLGLYNQRNSEGDHKERVVDSVKRWFKREALNAGWNKAEFSGNQCILTMVFPEKKETELQGTLNN